MQLILFTVRLIIYGQFTLVTNATDPHDPKVRIQTTVHCVLRNVNNIDVPSSIVIVDYEENTYNKNDLRDIRTGVEVVCVAV